ncbi:hypothetical protein G9A89_004614 [Geosiphon pyriformis]|nr:hypothetical protein G9A89_004614 [Geosiphon pyriformis]
MKCYHQTFLLSFLIFLNLFLIIGLIPHTSYAISPGINPFAQLLPRSAKRNSELKSALPKKIESIQDLNEGTTSNTTITIQAIITIPWNYTSTDLPASSPEISTATIKPNEMTEKSLKSKPLKKKPKKFKQLKIVKRKISPDKNERKGNKPRIPKSKSESVLDDTVDDTVDDKVDEITTILPTDKSQSLPIDLPDNTTIVIDLIATVNTTVAKLNNTDVTDEMEDPHLQHRISRSKLNEDISKLEKPIEKKLEKNSRLCPKSN